MPSSTLDLPGWFTARQGAAAIGYQTAWAFTRWARSVGLVGVRRGKALLYARRGLEVVLSSHSHTVGRRVA